MKGQHTRLTFRFNDLNYPPQGLKSHQKIVKRTFFVPPQTLLFNNSNTHILRFSVTKENTIPIMMHVAQIAPLQFQIFIYSLYNIRECCEAHSLIGSLINFTPKRVDGGGKIPIMLLLVIVRFRDDAIDHWAIKTPRTKKFLKKLNERGKVG